MNNQKRTSFQNSLYDNYYIRRVIEMYEFAGYQLDKSIVMERLQKVKEGAGIKDFSSMSQISYIAKLVFEKNGELDKFTDEEKKTIYRLGGYRKEMVASSEKGGNVYEQ